MASSSHHAASNCGPRSESGSSEEKTWAIAPFDHSRRLRLGDQTGWTPDGRLIRVTGRAVLGAIALAGTAGFLLSWVNAAGPIGTAGFGTLAVLWVGFAALGLRAILRGDVATHRRWMLRTFALTYAAVTLRLWLFALIPLLGDFHSAYLVVPFLSWVPNLLLVEWLLRR